MLDDAPATGKRRFLHEIPVAEVTAKKRWSRDDWIVCAYDAMEREGLGAVRIEELARRAGRTPGSFYAHFNSRDELLGAMLDDWTQFKLARIMYLDSELYHAHKFSVEGIFERVRKGGDRGRATLELGIREWARLDERARAAVMRTDMLRMNNGTSAVVAEFPNAPHPQVFILMFIWLLRGRQLVFTDPNDKALADSWDLAAEAFVQMYKAMAEKFRVAGAPRWVGKFKPLEQSPMGDLEAAHPKRGEVPKGRPRPRTKRRRR